MPQWFCAASQMIESGITAPTRRVEVKNEHIKNHSGNHERKIAHIVRTIPTHRFQPILAQFPIQAFLDRAMPKKKGPSSNALDIIDIHLEWDGDADLRQRLLDGGSVMAPGPCCEDISTCLKNRALLAPILTKMASHESRKVPPIDSLVDEILRLLGRAKRGPETENQSDVISKSSSAIKKLCGFVKMKCRRREVSTVTGTQICRIRVRGFTGCRFLYL